MVKICLEIINFLFFGSDKIKYCPGKKSAQFFEKFTQSPSPARDFQNILMDLWTITPVQW